MCGIVGVVGKNEAISFLVSGLKMLEYRGYDSSGITVFKSDSKDSLKNNFNSINNDVKTGFETTKKTGRISVLEENLNMNDLSDVGIGHTRWATHGKPSDINAHPHVSENKKFSVVHNGIIENYMELKKFLIENGKKFVSDTDTETVVQLLEYLYDGDFLNTVKMAVNTLEGAFALGILCSDFPDRLISVKKDSPLIVGVGEGEHYIASDIQPLLPKTKTICRLQENEIAVLFKDSFKIYDFEGNEKPKNIAVIDWHVESGDKGDFEHYMLKEIMEQPRVITQTIMPRIDHNKAVLEGIDLSEDYFKNLQKIFIVACGSAYHVGCVSKYVIEKLAKVPVEVDIASEFRYRNPIVNKNTLVIIISQSGETADSLAALREAKKHGAKVLSIVNVVGSSIANESDYVLYTWAGPEIAVATTKAYSTQLSLIYLLTLFMAQKLNTLSGTQIESYISQIKALPNQIDEILAAKDDIQKIAENYYDSQKTFFIGRNVDYATCMEGSLKLKEISYINSECYAAGELKHGTISLIEQNTLVIAVCTQDNLFEKLVSNIREVKARGATILMVTTHDKASQIDDIADSVIFVPKTASELNSSLAVIPLQLLSYYIAKLRGCDIDKPRNLAKSVTVE